MSSSGPQLYIALLHDQMVDKQGDLVTTSITLIDVHDIARSSRTYGVKSTFVAHPSSALRKLSRTLKGHWEEGFGAEYNPNRKEALSIIEIVTDLDEAVQKIDFAHGKLPKLIATSARTGPQRHSFETLRQVLHTSSDPYLLMLGTGWGMSEKLLERADFFLEPIVGPTAYNHLSVRSACAIMLDRLLRP
ncbi:MAG: RNA methyltransferase [Deltaproteobacteria bacterium]|nr:RNA methyltransferase [Deltaproteobacteria bacterium]